VGVCFSLSLLPGATKKELMDYPEIIQHQKSPTGWQLLLAALLFLLVQLNLTVHNTEHLTSEHAGYECELCLSGGLDLGSPLEKAELSGRIVSADTFTFEANPFSPRHSSAYRTRAPPALK